MRTLNLIALLRTSRALSCLALAALCIGAGACVPSRATAQSPAPTSRVTGVIFDSLDNRPLGDATVQLIEAPPGHHSYAASSDSLGRFAIEGVLAGKYIAGFLHPLLDTLGVAAPYAPVAVAEGSDVRLSLAVPGERSLAHAICGNAASTDSVGMIVGHVRDATTGAPMAASAVTIQWPTLVFGTGGPHTESRQLHATTTGEGWFAICGLRANDYQIHAEHGARATALIDVTIWPHDIARLPLLLGTDASGPDSASRGLALLTGIVTTPNGRPLEGAQVMVDGSAASATTDARGSFSLSGLPDGTRMAEVRALGYEPVRVRVEPARSQPRTVTIAMAKPVETLDAVTVFGKSHQRMRDLTGFTERKRKGFGRFLTQKDIADRNVISACDLLRRVPGVTVVDDGTTGCTANIRGATTGAAAAGTQVAPHLCEPTVYEDNVRFGGTVSEFTRTVTAKEIMGIEVYTTATEPPQFAGACGAIVIWTRTGE